MLRGPTASVGTKEQLAFRDALRDGGLVEGRDFVIEVRWADGRRDALPRLAAELVALKPSVVVTGGAPAVNALLAADAAVPIVVLIGDAVAAGLARELGRPGGRVTGVSFIASSLDAKRLEFLALVVPKRSMVLELADPETRSGSRQPLVDTARTLGLTLHRVEATSLQDIEAAFTAANRLRVAAINVLASSFLHSNRIRIIDLATAAKLPTIWQWPEGADDGALLGYGPALTTMWAQLGPYVARILAGARAGDLPMQQPTKFELVINQKTARAIGVTVPAELLLRADRVID
ncbi:MAG TPA: ABC transporter substrate-binding protein [Casimicrobiaceae bacterium]|nr:ABC transporter substrate-binding protein [Casimicrobiaceae bacterium]